MDVHLALVELPSIALALVPELAAAHLPPEPRATCLDCAMTREGLEAGPTTPWAYRPEMRCCTYWPPLPSFLVGRALRRGGEGADLVRKSVADPASRSAWGCRPSADYLARANAASFGWDVTLRCPYASNTASACGIWPDRGAACRTFFCKLEDGVVAEARWNAVALALEAVWDVLARWCEAVAEPPDDDAPPAAWEAWYRACAERVDQAELVDVLPFAGRPLERARMDLDGALALTRAPIPERVTPVFRSIARPGGDHWLFARARADGLALSAEALARVEALGGARPWREALGDTAEARTLVSELVRIGALVDAAAVALRPGPRASDAPPEVLVPAIRRVEPAGDRLVLHSHASPEPLLVERTAFAFIARLDGVAGWRDALAAALADGASGLDEALVLDLWRHGLLVGA